MTGNREIAEKQISDDIKSACNLITGALITSNIITCNIITCNQSTLTGDTDVNTLQTIKTLMGVRFVNRRF